MMLHRSFLLFLMVSLLPIGLFAQKDSSSVHERALELFEENRSELEKSRDTEIKYRTVHVGHLNEDQGLDAVVEFGLGSKEGNRVVERRVAIYLQQAAGIEPVGRIEPDYCPDVAGIENRSLIVKDLGSCVAPSEKRTLRYRWNGKEMELEGEK